MRYRRLGRSGLAVSPIGLGTMGFGPPTPAADAGRLIHSALELGVNVLDTANCYDGLQRGEIVAGHAESVLGELLTPKLRDEFVLVSKVGVPLRPGPQHRGLSSTHVLRELDNSLRRLKTDYLDVYLLHWPDPYSDNNEVLRAMNRAVTSGKVRYFGVSNHQAWQVCEYLWAADQHNLPAATVNELPVSLLDRRYENDLPFYARHEIGVLAYQPLHGGVLSDRRVREHQSAELAAGSKISSWSPQVSAAQKPLLLELARFATELSLTLSELAIAWTAAQSAISSVVLGARSADQLASGLKAAESRIPPEILDKIDQLCPPPQKPVPRFER